MSVSLSDAEVMLNEDREVGESRRRGKWSYLKICDLVTVEPSKSARFHQSYMYVPTEAMAVAERIRCPLEPHHSYHESNDRY